MGYEIKVWGISEENSDNLQEVITRLVDEEVSAAIKEIISDELSLTMVGAELKICVRQPIDSIKQVSFYKTFQQALEEICDIEPEYYDAVKDCILKTIKHCDEYIDK